MLSEGPQRVAVPVLALRGVFQIEEGVRGPLAEQARAQGDGQRRQAQVAEGDAGAEQGMLYEVTMTPSGMGKSVTVADCHFIRRYFT